MKVFELFEDAYSAKELSSNDPAEVAKILKKECSTFVNAYANTSRLIMRGIRELKGTPVHFAQAQIRPDRKPIFMPTEHHDLINKAMIELGLKAHRGNSIFCTRSRLTAANWGDVYTIFPTDGWVGTVFQKVKHNYVFDKVYEAADNILEKNKNNFRNAVAEMSEVLSDLKPYSFSSQGDLEIVIREGYEDILITGKKYYALSLDSSGDPTPETNDVFGILGI
jgi:hypothetical protein